MMDRCLMTEPTPSIAIVDDDAAICDMLHDLLTDEGYQVVCYSNSTDFLDSLNQQIPNLLLLDIHLEHAIDGWDILTELRNCPTTTTVPVIVITADITVYIDEARLENLQAMRLDKPFVIQNLLALVSQALTDTPSVGC